MSIINYDSDAAPSPTNWKKKVSSGKFRASDLLQTRKGGGFVGPTHTSHVGLETSQRRGVFERSGEKVRCSLHEVEINGIHGSELQSMLCRYVLIGLGAL